MADPRDDLATIADGVRRVTTLPGPQELRRRSEQRRRRRTAVTGVGLAVVAVTVGTTVLQARNHVVPPDPGVGPAGPVTPSVVPSAPPSAGPREILSGRRQVLIRVPGMGSAPLATGRDDDRVRATTERGIDDRALWVLHPEGDQFRIMLAAPDGTTRVCMTVVHDAAPGSVRGRACDPATQTQLFTIEKVADGTYSIFQGKRYVQVVDGTNALVPDLPEGLTTTYEFEDRGPASAERLGGVSTPTR